MNTKLGLGIIIGFVALNVLLAVIAIVSTRDRDLSLPDTAIEFQEAVFGGNYEAMWELSAPEYKAGLTRDQFIKRSRDTAPTPDRIFDWTVLNEKSNDLARVHTRVQLARGGIQTNEMTLRDIDGKWLITDYAAYDGPWPPIEPSLTGS